MIHRQRDGNATAVAWLILWAMVIAAIIILTADLTIGDQQSLDRRRAGAGLCLIYYSENGATGTRYVKCK